MATDKNDTRPFPIQQAKGQRDDEGRMSYPQESTIPWWLAEAAYKVYSSKYGKDQTLQRLAERGGFGRAELLWLLRGGRTDDWDATNTLVGFKDG